MKLKYLFWTAAATGTLTAWAETVTIGDLTVSLSADGTAVLEKMAAGAKTVIIPASVQYGGREYRVTSVASQALYYVQDAEYLELYADVDITDVVGELREVRSLFIGSKVSRIGSIKYFDPGWYGPSAGDADVVNNPFDECKELREVYVGAVDEAPMWYTHPSGKAYPSSEWHGNYWGPGWQYNVNHDRVLYVRPDITFPTFSLTYWEEMPWGDIRSRSETIKPYEQNFSEIKRVDGFVSLSLLSIDAPAKVGTTTTTGIKAEMWPVNTTFRYVIWSVDNEKVATIDDEGNLKALNPGLVTISARTPSGVTADPVTVEVVDIAAEEISPNYAEFVLPLNGRFTPEYTLLPAGAHKELTFESTDSEVMSVGSDGALQAVAEGECEIVVTARVGGCQIRVPARVVPAATFISILEPTEKLVVGGDPIQLEYVIEPAEAADQIVKWYSYSSDITVDGNGVVTAVKGNDWESTVYLNTLDYQNSTHIDLHSYYAAPEVFRFAYEEQTIQLETYQEMTIYVESYGENSSSKYTLKSSDPNILAANGTKVMGLGPGTVTLTALSDSYPQVTAEMTVTVTGEAKVWDIALDNDRIYITDGNIFPTAARGRHATADYGGSSGYTEVPVICVKYAEDTDMDLLRKIWTVTGWPRWTSSDSKIAYVDAIRTAWNYGYESWTETYNGVRIVAGGTPGIATLTFDPLNGMDPLICKVVVGVNLEVEGIKYMPISENECSAIEVTDAYDNASELTFAETVNYNGKELILTWIQSELHSNSTIRTMTIPATVECIISYAFTGMEGLDDVYCMASTPPNTWESDSYYGSGGSYGSSRLFNSHAYSAATLHVPADSYRDYCRHDSWLPFRLIVPDATSITEVECSNGDDEVVYYTLQGVRVNAPSTGVYIRMAGGRAETVMIK